MLRFPLLRSLGLVLLGGVASSIALEALTRPTGLAQWLREWPIEAAANAAVAVWVCAFLLAVSGRYLVAVVSSAALLGALGLIHTTKLAALGKPLFPWDVFLYREALALLPQVATGTWLLLGSVGLGLLAAALRLGPPPLAMRSRLAVLAGLIAVVLFLGPQPEKRLTQFGVLHRGWVQTENYRINGLLLAFVFNLNSAVIQKPSNYGAESVRVAATREPRLTPVNPSAPAAVIVVMSESFFDPTQLPGVSFREDPVPNLHRLQLEASSGALYSPVFGGGTANTEFEFLTGHSMHFLPAGSVPYQQYVRRRHTSLASIFSAAGYRTAAVHTFHRWFWERDQVYRHFGFERFVSLEDMPDAREDGLYTSDAVLTEHIVAEFEADPSKPLFLFGVSMEAHGPYTAMREASPSVHVEGPLDDGARRELATYAVSANHADRELGALIAYFEKIERPVYLVFFGDHLPSIPLSLRQTGIAESLESVNREQKQFLHRVPLIIWSNTREARRELGSLSPSFLGPLLLELTGTRGTRYTDFLLGVHKQMPIVMQGLVADSAGAFYDEVPVELRHLDQSWWTLEYDLLFGEDYLSAEEG